MQGAMTWSIPFTRIAGITVRIHLFFLIFMVAEVGRTAQFGSSLALEMFLILLMLFTIVLMHEFGHCYAARSVGGSAEEILLWPLGGLAYVQHPHNAWASFVTTAGGPAVNLLFFLVAGAMLLVAGYWPPMNPLWSVLGGPLDPLGPAEPVGLFVLPWYVTWLARFFFLNWFLFWFNVLCVGFPLDGGRLLQSALWPRLGYYTATKVACYAGYAVAIGLCCWAFIFLGKDHFEATLTTFAMAIFIFVCCQQELQRLEMGMMEEDTLGYDFSQGYTSLERSASAKQRRPGFLQRWLAERAERKRQREEDERLAEDKRVDDLLAKINAGGGIQALTPEEQRFMKRVSAKLRQRKKT
jgi:stage IV sporulation protein FB